MLLLYIKNSILLLMLMVLVMLWLFRMQNSSNSYQTCVSATIVLSRRWSQHRRSWTGPVAGRRSCFTDRQRSTMKPSLLRVNTTTVLHSTLAIGCHIGCTGIREIAFHLLTLSFDLQVKGIRSW